MSPDEARERLRLDLENQARMKYYRAALDGLRKKVDHHCQSCRAAFALDEGESPVRGTAAKPAVTIVEFSDFECRFCRDVQPALKQVLESHAKDVRLVFKHLPLEGHRNAVPAARAAYCAGSRTGSGNFTMRCLPQRACRRVFFDQDCVGDRARLAAIQRMPQFGAFARGA
jgi:hypothetical protein